MGLLDQAKTLGGIGSILELVPGVSILGYILVLVAVKYISNSLQDRSIFNNMLYAVITGILGVIVGVSILFTGAFFSMFSTGTGGLVGVFGSLAIVWIALIISAIFIRKSFNEIAVRLNIPNFKTAGTLYFIGAILTIVLIGFIILFVAYIFQIISFFAIQETRPPVQPPGPQFMPPSPPSP